MIRAETCSSPKVESTTPSRHIFGYRPNGSYFDVYPYKRHVSFFPTGFVLYGPIGGMVAKDNKIYVSHRDRQGLGVITVLGYDGSHSTVIAGLPARGDNGSDRPGDRPPPTGGFISASGRPRNSGVVGVDNWGRRVG